MNDNELRGVVLETFYKARHQVDWLSLSALMTHITASVNKTTVGSICNQLGEHGLIQWRPLMGGGAIAEGMGKITARGVDVMEGTVRSPISITLNDRRITVSDSTNVQIGNANSIRANIDINKVLAAIDQCSASPEERTEAKSLWSKLTNNAAFAAIVGAVVAATTTGAR